MKYHVIDVKTGRIRDEFEIAVTEDKEQAIKIARGEWECMTAHDKKESRIEVRVYVDEEEQLDYDTVEWVDKPFDSFR